MEVSMFRTPEQVITGWGSVSSITDHVQNLQASKVLVVTDPVIHKMGLTHKITLPLEKMEVRVDIEDRVQPEPPFENLEELYAIRADNGYDLLVGLGGGSTLDVTKVLAIMMTNKGDVRNFVGTNQVPGAGLPTILVPTTAGTGSEVTYNAIFTDVRDSVKKGIVSPYLLPAIAIVDAEMTLTTPASVTAATGLDALVHAVESYTARRSSALTDGIALQAITLISHSLRQAVYNGRDHKARENMAMGSMLAGISLANAGAGAVHALAYPLGGKFKVAHGVANALLLPFVMKYNVVDDLPKFSVVAESMGENIGGLSSREAADRVVHSMKLLAQDIGIPSNLKEVGVSKEDIPLLAEEAGKIDRLLNNNPRQLTTEEITAIYTDAYYA